MNQAEIFCLYLPFAVHGFYLPGHFHACTSADREAEAMAESDVWSRSAVNPHAPVCTERTLLLAASIFTEQHLLGKE